MTLVLLFIFGLAAGSFLNVVALRYDPEKSVFHLPALGGRSHCPQCGTQLRWYELVPVMSFLLLRGRCRTCHAPISWQYPLVELAAAASFLFPVYFYDRYHIAQYAANNLWWFYALSIIAVVVALICILIAVIDFRLYIIPDELNWALALLGASRAATLFAADKFDLVFGTFLGNYAMVFGFAEQVFLNAALGAFFGLAFFGIIIALTRGRGMGLGDMKLGGALGAVLGFPDIAFAIMLAFITGALVSIPLLLLRRRGLKDALPFGPFIILGAALAVFFGHDLLNAYFTVFNL